MKQTGELRWLTDAYGLFSVRGGVLPVSAESMRMAMMKRERQAANRSVRAFTDDTLGNAAIQTSSVLLDNENDFSIEDG